LREECHHKNAKGEISDFSQHRQFFPRWSENWQPFWWCLQQLARAKITNGNSRSAQEAQWRPIAGSVALGQQEVSDISRDLKVLAKELNVPVIALSQLNREVEHRSPPVPVLSDLRDSGAVEQDADMVMFIYRGDIYEPNTDVGAKLIVAKQCNGPTGDVKLVFNNTFARFDDRADAHQERFAQVRIA
jgi:DnaB-like helicase C terminal domain